MVTARRLAIQARACQTWVTVGPPRHRVRKASTVMVIGLGERHADREGESDRGQRGAGPGVEPEPDQGADADHEGQHEQVAQRVGQGAAGQYGGAGHRQGAEPVDHPGGEVVGDRGAGL